ncbi:MAG: MYXO-CTERM sorting domain-containing protein [Bradymonadaceae bacterium]
MKTSAGVCGCGTPKNECLGDAGDVGDTDAESGDATGELDTVPTIDTVPSYDGWGDTGTDSDEDTGIRGGLDWGGGERREDGCRCRATDGRPAGGLLMAGLLLLGLLVRRRW